MSFYLFESEPNGDMCSSDPTVMFVPEFKEVKKHPDLGNKALRWIALIYDYKSPYARMSLEERKEKVTKDIFGKQNAKLVELPEMKAATLEYIRLQYDPLIEINDIYRKKIEEQTILLRDTKITIENAKKVQEISRGQR